MADLWTLVDLDVQPRPVFLRPGDICYFAREYTSEGGYKASTANNLINNFKKDPSKRGTNQWFYKERAAKQFAEELAESLPDDCHIAVIPTSKPDGHPEYDPRFDMMLGNFLKARPDITVCAPIYRTEACQSLHTGGRRSVTEVLKTLRWQGFDDETPSSIFLLDDVLTCGTTFRACKLLLTQHCPGIEIVGIFWAKTVWLSGDEPDWELVD